MPAPRLHIEGRMPSPQGDRGRPALGIDGKKLCAKCLSPTGLDRAALCRTCRTEERLVYFRERRRRRSQLKALQETARGRNLTYASAHVASDENGIFISPAAAAEARRLAVRLMELSTETRRELSAKRTRPTSDELLRRDLADAAIDLVTSLYSVLAGK